MHRAAHLALLLLVISALGAAFGAAQAQALSFTRHDYAIAGAGAGLAVGDFNRDGSVDVVSDGGLGGVAGIMVNDGAGILSDPVAIEAGVWPDDMAVADLNGDGKLDLAVIDGTGSCVRVLLGNGRGGFTSAGEFTTAWGGKGIVAADFNGDDVPDLAVTENSIGAVAVLLGEGDGTFEDKVDYAVGSFPNGITAADFTGDGVVDLAVASYGDGTVAILLAKGDGTFAARGDVPAPAAYAVAAIDLNGDGNDDLAVSDYNTGAVKLMAGDGQGGFASPVAPPLAAAQRAADLAFGDLDGDGLSDLVVASADSSSLAVYRGLGDGAFAAPLSFATGDYPGALRLVDMNGDGALDMVAADGGSGAVSVLLNDGSMPQGTLTLDNGREEAASSAVATVDSAVTDAYQMRVRDHGGAWGAWQPYSDQLTWQLPAGDGSKTVDVQYRSHRNEVLELSASIMLDTTAPATTDDAPAGWSRDDVTVTLTPFDTGAGLATTDYKLDDADWAQGTSVAVSGDGVHTIQYRSADLAGNVEQVTERMVRIDGQAPQTTDDAPAGWVGAAALPLTVHLSADADGGSPVTGIEYRVDGAGAWSDGAAVSLSGNGVHTIEYRSTDAAGNVEDVRTRDVSIDSVRPVTSGLAVSVVRGRKATFNVKVGDAVFGDPSQAVTIDILNARGKLVKTLSGFGRVRPNATAPLVWAKCTLARGAYRYVVKATDAAGNRQIKAGGNRLVVK